jgi:hypothetical protein
MLLQVTDYAELVSRPGDFATLRQKNKDGMYTALEQFEVLFLTQLLSLSFPFYGFNFHPRPYTQKRKDPSSTGLNKE